MSGSIENGKYEYLHEYLTPPFLEFQLFRGYWGGGDDHQELNSTISVQVGNAVLVKANFASLGFKSRTWGAVLPMHYWLKQLFQT